MAFPTSVNDQVTDSITQTNTKVLGDSPAIAMGNLFVATSQALSNAAHNATNNQQQSYVVMHAATTQASRRCSRSIWRRPEWRPRRSTAEELLRRAGLERGPLGG